MTLADKITMVRIVLAPIFFAVYLLPVPALWQAAALWAVFAVSELSDMLDGQAARRLKQGSDFGKLFDPFADTFTQITFLLCFVIEGIFPVWLFLVVLYREYAVLFVRNLMLRKGVTMGARMAGKVKTVAYIAAEAAALAAVSLTRLGSAGYLAFDTAKAGSALRIAARVTFCVSVALSVYSFAEYLVTYLKAPPRENC
ncbi:MAG: CDP-diacylglycerol--glycerol-3-phosphate 3-phosphatidyltransferase [Treponema sp.]|jgi:CDP-diacylglycerol--glycerol-3-phosphate 3-phosphatidyltransferase|nr:CDP-diacylglycerol--glycerol-3-phosphate 3-phosphatidyltransferase [Treponema sp.]